MKKNIPSIHVSSLVIVIESSFGGRLDIFEIFIRWLDIGIFNYLDKVTKKRMV